MGEELIWTDADERDNPWNRLGTHDCPKPDHWHDRLASTGAFDESPRDE